MHDCPLCGGQVYHKEDHPTEVCPFCVTNAHNISGQPIAILPSTYWQRGFEIRLRENDTIENRCDNPVCYIAGKKCSIVKYFGHIVVQIDM